MKKKTYLLALLPILILSCGQKKEALIEKPAKQAITIIVNQYNKIQFGVPSLYLFNGLEDVSYILRNADKPDTISFEVSLPLTEIAYFHANGFYYSYPAQGGDTITIDFVNNLPVAKTTSKTYTSNDLNWQANIQHQHSSFNEKPLIYHLLFTRDSSKLFEHLNKFQQEILTKKRYLDSLNKHKSIDSINYLWQVKGLKLFSEEINYEKTLKLNKPFNYSGIANDSLLPLNQYRGFIKSIVFSESHKSNKNYGNSKFCFDWLIQDSLITVKTKELLLYDYLKDIAEYNPTQDFSSAKRTFGNFVKDTLYNSLIDRITPVQLKSDFKTSNDLQLMDINGNPSDFSTLLPELKHNVVYVDFWASWCAPCRHAMPSAKKLREEYKAKNVRFVYLSLDRNTFNWENGIKQCELSKNELNYLVVNFEKADLHKQLKIATIPRYLIYDKNGKLVEPNAPGPESNEIRELLDKYLMN